MKALVVYHDLDHDLDHDEHLCVSRVGGILFNSLGVQKIKRRIPMRINVCLKIFAILANVDFNLKKLPPPPPQPPPLPPPHHIPLYNTKITPTTGDLIFLTPPISPPREFPKYANNCVRKGQPLLLRRFLQWSPVKQSEFQNHGNTAR